jgi:hypothetical protein
MDREAALRKLRACLRLASSSNPNEAATALRQAQAMMAAYGLSVDDVDKDEIREHAARTRSRGGYLPAHVWELACLVAKLFRGFVYQNMDSSSGVDLVARVGKKVAGRLLDGAIHDAFPVVRT